MIELISNEAMEQWLDYDLEDEQDEQDLKDAKAEYWCDCERDGEL